MPARMAWSASTLLSVRGCAWSSFAKRCGVSPASSASGPSRAMPGTSATDLTMYTASRFSVPCSVTSRARPSSKDTTMTSGPRKVARASRGWSRSRIHPARAMWTTRSSPAHWRSTNLPKRAHPTTRSPPSAAGGGSNVFSAATDRMDTLAMTAPRSCVSRERASAVTSGSSGILATSSPIAPAIQPARTQPRGDPDNARVGITPGRAAAHPRRRVARARDAEDVLCVPRTTIFPDGAWHGLVTRGLERLLRTVNAVSEYRPRADVEDDPALQQIIPYCVVHHPHDDTYLITRRLRRSSEKRLHHLYSLGIGGHVNPGDGEAGDPVIGGLRREWAEEISCGSPATARLVAAINDDSSPVSRVHLGLVFLVEPALGVVDVRETDKLEGESMALGAMRNRYLSMESWSQLVFDDLVNGAVPRAPRSPP